MQYLKILEYHVEVSYFLSESESSGQEGEPKKVIAQSAGFMQCWLERKSVVKRFKNLGKL